MDPMYVASTPSPAGRSSVNACERKSAEGQQKGTNAILEGRFSFIISSEMCPLPGMCALVLVRNSCNIYRSQDVEAAPMSNYR